jgi:hypothetical protein
MPETPEAGSRTVQEMKLAGADTINLIYDDLSQGGRPPAPIMHPEVMRSIINEAGFIAEIRWRKECVVDSAITQRTTCR